MSENLLGAKRREPSGKGGARQLRIAGSIPGVYYGHNEPTIHFSIDAVDFAKLMRGHHRIVDLKIDSDDARPCLIREIQRDPVDEKPYHIDFLAVHTGEKLTTSVPIKLIGTAIGVKTDAGILEHGVTELFVECFPLDLPEVIEVDVSGLAIGHAIHVRDLEIPKIRILDDGNVTVAHVASPTVHREGAVAAATDIAEGEEPKE